MPKVELLPKSILETPSPVSVFFAFKDAELTKELKEIDKKVGGLLSGIMKEESFEGKSGQFFVFHAHQRGLRIDRLVVVGLGDKKKIVLRQLSNNFGSALRLVQKKKISKVSVCIPQELRAKFKDADLAKELVEASFISPYQFGHYKSKKEDILPDLAELVISEPQKKYHKDISIGIEEGVVIGRFMNLVRDAGNQPSSTATPTYMANMALDIAKENKSVKVKIMGRDEMKKLKMGGLLGVSQGSEEPAKFIVMEYMGNPRSKDIYAYVGKAITFDSGGISLKPGEKMEDMKYDMSGGGAVITSIGAIAALKLPINIVGCVPSTENLPSGRAYKPGDILVAMNGKSMEVQNTDAEGRLILSDGLSYATMTYKPKAVVDMATLTGACVIALGEHAAGLMGNDQKWIDRVKAAGETSGDRTWQLPLWSEYHEQIKSDFADIRNIGGRPAGTITAAAFLSNFVGETPWAHVDIAATAWHEGEKPYMKKGATGFGLRLLVALAKDLAGKKK